MGKLNDIVGYYNWFGEHKFNDNDLWRGKIILEDDGWFEGIVWDAKSLFPGNIVFGYYHEGENIELFKITQCGSIISYNGKLDDKGYSGSFSFLENFGEFSCGGANIRVEDVEDLIEKNDSRALGRDACIEKKEIMRTLYKRRDVRYRFKDLYESIISVRTIIYDLTNSYKDVELTDEERSFIASKVSDVKLTVQQDGGFLKKLGKRYK